jgi:hypothetical protein
MLLPPWVANGGKATHGLGWVTGRQEGVRSPHVKVNLVAVYQPQWLPHNKPIVESAVNNSIFRHEAV